MYDRAIETYVIKHAEGRKGRSFGAKCVGFTTADALWPSRGGSIRPVWTVFAGTETELRPFVANLQAGRKAERGR